MSIKVRSLGSITSAANGITCSSSTNATPIVLTVGTGHGLKPGAPGIGDRITVSGITGNTNANGDFTVSAVTATTATLFGSVGNGAHGGTAVVAALMDQTPHMKAHSAQALIGNTSGQAVLVGTVLVESSDDNTTFADAIATGIAVPAATAGINVSFEVTLKKYMRFRCSAYTSGGANCQIAA